MGGDAQIGAPAPAFSCQALVNGEFKNVSLDQFKGKYVVLFFYPLDFTFVCPTEIIAFSEAAAQFKKINCQVLAASTDSVFSHLAWTNTTRKDGGLGEMKIPINDLPVGRSVDETLRLVQAFQFVDEHGEVCPAGWKPGKETMKADPQGSKEYFSKQ